MEKGVHQKLHGERGKHDPLSEQGIYSLCERGYILGKHIWLSKTQAYYVYKDEAKGNRHIQIRGRSYNWEFYEKELAKVRYSKELLWAYG